MREFMIGILSLLVLTVFFSCDSKSETKTATKTTEIKVETIKTKFDSIEIPADAINTESGLKYVDVVIGHGASPKKGQKVSVHYKGMLMSGKKFDSSYDRNEPLEFAADVGQMIKGFDEGVVSMKKGGKRTLYIPSNLAYGANGIPGVIPPDAMIVFEVELVDIK